MLNPDWLEGCPDEIIKIYQDAENAILQQMADQINKYNYFLPSSMHSKALVQATGATQQAVAEELAKITGKSKAAVTKLMTEAGNQTIEEDGKVYKAAKVYKDNAISKKAMNNIVQVGISQAMSALQNITRTTANAAGTQIYRALDSSWMQVSTGAIDRIKAVEASIKQLADSGLSAFTYDSGHVDTLEVAVRRAVVTGVNQTSLRVSGQMAEDLGCDLVEVSAHAGARPDHAKWQGHIFSRSGKSDKYPALSAPQEAGGTGYGTGAGLGGWNCRHSFGPWFEGSSRRWSQEQLDQMNEKNVRYNGKDMTQYEASQQQRYYERQIRKYKREEALGVEGASDKVKLWQDKQKDFIDQTGFKRQYDRERIWLTNNKNGGSIKRESSITGARIVDILSDEADKHAERYYGLVRSMSTDVKRISKNTGIPEDTIQSIKNFLFLDLHDLGNGEPELFAPDFAIAESWQRLIAGTPEKHDLTLLKHEQYEKSLMADGMDQDSAHRLASKKYNYSVESDDFYAELKKRQNSR